MRRPTVRMIRHPPSAVPAVSATEQATVVQVGAESVWIRPSARSNAAMMPTDFCASLAPWLNARAAEVTHWLRRTGSTQRRVARRPARRSDRITISAPSAPRVRGDGERDQRAEHADRMDAVEAAPLNRIEATL